MAYKEVYLKTATGNRIVNGEEWDVDNVVREYVAMGETVEHEEILRITG